MQPEEATQPVEANLCKLLRERYGVANKLQEYTKNTQANLQQPLLVCFGHFDQNDQALIEQLDQFQTLSLEYDADITFAVGDMSAIHIFLNREKDDEKIEKHNRLKTYGEDAFGKYGFPDDHYYCWKQLCEKLRSGQMWQGVVLNDEEEKSCNLYSIMAEAGDKDVFVLFYDPKCPNSEHDQRVLQELARQLAEEEILIVTFNIDNNTWGLKYVYIEYIVECWLLCYNVLSGRLCYPSFFLLDKNGETNIYYGSPQRTLESFRNFIAKNAKIELAHYKRDGTKKDL